MEVIENRTLRLPDWNHTSTLELDGSFMFAIPVYFIVRNIFLAVGIANIILLGLYLFAVSRILYHSGTQKACIYLTLCLVITPYSYGMLEYFNMMFFGGSCYSVKTLVPLLLLLLFQLFGEDTKMPKAHKAETVFVGIMYAVLLFVTAFSTGIYVMLCGIFPIILCMGLDIWTDGTKTHKYNKYHLGLLAGSFLTFIFGYILHKIYYTGVSRTGMQLTKFENYDINFRACLAGIFQVFGALTSDDIPAFSPWGIIYCLKMGLVVLFIVALIYNIRLLFGKTNKFDISKYLTLLFLFNFVVLLVADSRYPGNLHTEYRYFLIGAVPLILLTGIRISDWIKRYNFFQQQTAAAFMFIALMLIMVGNNKQVVDKWDRTTYAVELCDYFNTLDVESVFFVNDRDTAIICKGIDRNHKYAAYMTETQSINLSICSYYSSQSGSFYGDSNVLAVIENNNLNELIPEEIAAHYEKIGKIRWYDIYYSDRVYFP